jgi:transcriptional regulator with XRE-family HTH domain
MTRAERVGRWLRAAREKRGLSRAAAARLVGKEMSAIYRYETGASQPDWDTLWAMCRVYKVRVRDVVDPVKPPKAIKTKTIAA